MEYNVILTLCISANKWSATYVFELPIPESDTQVQFGALVTTFASSIKAPDTSVCGEG